MLINFMNEVLDPESSVSAVLVFSLVDCSQSEEVTLDLIASSRVIDSLGSDEPWIRGLFLHLSQERGKEPSLLDLERVFLAGVNAHIKDGKVLSHDLVSFGCFC